MTSAVAIGVGCRRGVGAAEVAALVRESLASIDLPLASAALFTVSERAREAGLVAAAVELGMPLVALSRAQLAGVVTPAQSPRVLELFGVGSIAEGAALVGAGRGAVLAVPRVSRENVTCAVAVAGSATP